MLTTHFHYNPWEKNKREGVNVNVMTFLKCKTCSSLLEHIAVVQRSRTCKGQKTQVIRDKNAASSIVRKNAHLRDPILFCSI